MTKKTGPQLLLLLAILLPFFSFAQVLPPVKPGQPEPPEKPEAVAGIVEIATFAGGCFWCTEAYFERLKGVQRVVAGYAGGKEKDPTYAQVSNGKTGHAECVQITFDPQFISYADLLKVHFATHDPTTLNRQGPDVGKQYRSMVIYHSPEQKKLAENYISALNKSGKFKNKIVTEVVPYSKFYPAEEKHQNYYVRNPKDPYVLSVARPKVEKFEKEFKAWLKEPGKK
ncbi:MAG TPA: peptide-methionine (S)-S-oxide reductase MsrA [Adhaeribacter sp.]|nr:peptide-methionine (S)-S-oxide reductase MsrA [Adhaeribacter sp.]